MTGRMAGKDYHHLFKLLIIGDSSQYLCFRMFVTNCVGFMSNIELLCLTVSKNLFSIDNV